MSKNLKQIKVNFALKDHEKLTMIAEADGVTKAQWIRNNLGATFDNPREPHRKKIHQKTDPELLYHLSKIGTNLNQISRHANEKKFIDKEVLLALLNIQNDLKQLL